jgi:hypothetical protein
MIWRTTTLMTTGTITTVPTMRPGSTRRRAASPN